MTLMRRRSLLLVPVLVTVIALAVAVYAVAATDTAGEGKIRRWVGEQTSGGVCTSSTSFVDMPGVVVPLTLARDGRVVLLFQGQFGGFDSTSGARAGIRLTVDGASVGGAAIGNDHGTGVQTFGYNAFSATLAAGAHTAKVLWHTFPSGATSCVEERSLIVLLH